MRGMRKLRENLPNRVYHLISRVAHRAFFLNAEERTRFVELLKELRRVRPLSCGGSDPCDTVGVIRLVEIMV